MLSIGFKFAAEAAGPIFEVAKGQEEGAIRREFLHATVHGFGRVDVALLVERDEIGASGPRLDVGIAAELARFRSVFAPRRQESAVRIEHLHAVIGLIGYIHAAVLRNGHPARITEFTRAGAGFTPLVKQLAGGTVDSEAVGVDFFADRPQLEND